MPLIILAIVLLLLIILSTAGFLMLQTSRSKGSISRGLNMTLFLVKLPRESGSEKESQRPEKELIAVMEQLYSSFSNIHVTGWNKFLYGEPYIALELSVHHVGEEIHFYVAVPRSYEQVFEKQVYGLFPKSEVLKIKDYNVFNPKGATAGAVMTMKANAILPFKTYTRLESDPLGALVTSLSRLEHEGEGAAVQLLIRPSHRENVRRLAQKVAREMQAGNDFNRALKLAQSGQKKKKPEEKGFQPPAVVTPFEEEIIKSLQAKASRPLFDTNIRILTSAPDQLRADQLLADVTGAFVQFSSPDLNSFKDAKLTGPALDKLVYNFSFRLFDDSKAIPLSSEEITSLYHFPMTAAQLPRVLFLTAKTSEPPANLPQEGIVLGDNLYRGRKVPVRMLDEDRRRHTYIIGQTGTGKSTLMKSMIKQDIENGKGVCVIDPHGEFAEYALSIVPKSRVEDVIYFNPADTERPLGMNLFEFDPTQPQQKTFITNEFYSTIKTVYKDLPEAFGPMFEQYYKNSVLLVMDVFQRDFEENGNRLEGIEDRMPTLAEIPRVLADEDYRRYLLSRETNPLVKNFWEQEAEKAGGEAALANMVPYITSKLNPFLSNDYLRPIVVQPKSAFNFRDVMDGQKILLVNLSKGKIGDLNANLLGLVVISKLLMAALSRETSDQSALKDLYLYIDEFQNFTTPSISTILSEARKYRLDLILAHQFIKQLQEDIRNAVFGNVGSMVVFRISADDAETDVMKNNFAPVFGPQDLVNIPNMNGYLKLLIKGQPTRPFNMRLRFEEVFSAGSVQGAQAIAEISRLKYGRPRDEVEEEVKSRYRG